MSAAEPLRPTPAMAHWQLVDELLAERYGPLAELEREAVRQPRRDGAGRLQVVTDAARRDRRADREEVGRHG